MAATEGTKKRGRPAKFAGERTRGSLTIRLRDEVRAELEQAAVRYGRSLSEEIETRMEVSLGFKNQLKYEWGEDLFRIASAMASSLSQIEHYFSSNWIDNEKAQSVFKLTAAQIIENYLKIQRGEAGSVPHGLLDEMSEKQLAEVFAATGGLAPPRSKRKPVEIMITDD